MVVEIVWLVVEGRIGDVFIEVFVVVVIGALVCVDVLFDDDDDDNEIVVVSVVLWLVVELVV